MIWRKVLDELKVFWDEIVFQNGPRYKHPKQWVHLYADFWVSFFSMSYTLGHVAAIGVPLAIILIVI